MRLREWLLSLILVASGIACGPPYQGTFFVGRVYDGSDGTRLTSYKISAEYLDQTVTGIVDKTGYYIVGPVPPYQDFTITIAATGYRPFMSHNHMLKDPATRTAESWYFDAYLFPTTLQSPAVNFNITTQDNATPHGGALRLQPVAASTTYGITPGINAVTGSSTIQVWDNAEDLQAGTFTTTFTDGAASVPAGALVYGIDYDVTVLGVDGYAEYDSGTQTPPSYFHAGFDGDTSIILSPLTQGQLRLVFNSGTQPGVLTPDYSLTLIFNQPIALDATVDSNALTFFLNQSFSIDSPNTDPTGTGNVLNPTPTRMTPADFRGVDYNISGNTLTLTWDPTRGLQTADRQDVIYSVVYGGLSQFPIRPANDASASSALLSTFVGPSETVTGVAKPPPSEAP